jgi:hypothetical protein
MMQLVARLAAPRGSRSTLPIATAATFSGNLALVKPIARPLAPAIDASRFFNWLRSNGYIGEFLWRDLLVLYDIYAEDERLVPMSPLMRSMFAQQLGKLCRRGQVRVTENDRRRRLTTYTVPALAELAA